MLDYKRKFREILSHNWLKSELITIKTIVSTQSVLFEDTLTDLKFTKRNVIKADVCDIDIRGEQKSVWHTLKTNINQCVLFSR